MAKPRKGRGRRTPKKTKKTKTPPRRTPKRRGGVKPGSGKRRVKGQASKPRRRPQPKKKPGGKRKTPAPRKRRPTVPKPSYAETLVEAVSRRIDHDPRYSVDDELIKKLERAQVIEKDSQEATGDEAYEWVWEQIGIEMDLSKHDVYSWLLGYPPDDIGAAA